MVTLIEPPEALWTITFATAAARCRRWSRSGRWVVRVGAHHRGGLWRQLCHVVLLGGDGGDGLELQGQPEAGRLHRVVAAYRPGLVADGGRNGPTTSPDTVGAHRLKRPSTWSTRNSASASNPAPQLIWKP
jgi:hypothetical protein